MVARVGSGRFDIRWNKTLQDYRKYKEGQANNAAKDPVREDEYSRVRFINKQEIGELNKDGDLDLGYEFVNDAYSKGHLCAVVLQGRHVISYAWFSFSYSFVDDNLCYTPKENTIYLYKAYTRPEFRGRGYLSMIVDWVCSQHVDKFSKIATIMELQNFASFRSFKKAGFRPEGLALSFRFSSKRFLFRTYLAKKHLLSLH